MSRLIPFMTLEFSLKASSTIFASDAQGPGEIDSEDHGGYGIVATDISEAQLLQCWSSSFVPGKAVVKLDGSLGKKFGDRTNLIPTIPFTRLPRSIFDADWTVLAHGRWKITDHITLGEGRAHFKILQGLVAQGDTHDTRIIALEDNFAVAASMSKGRSPAPALNYIVRRRAASSLAANIVADVPWIETSVMPADAASRLKHGDSTGAPDGSSLPRPDHRPAGAADYGAEVSKGVAAFPVVHH